MLSMGDETIWLTRYDIWDKVFNFLISLYMTFCTILCTFVGISPDKSTVGIGESFPAKRIYLNDQIDTIS